MQRDATSRAERLCTAGEVARATGAAAPPAAPEDFPSVSTDTRAILAGALFVALKGDRFDAHDYLAEARAKGAGAAVIRKGTPAVPGLPLFAVEDTFLSLIHISEPTRRTPISY